MDMDNQDNLQNENKSEPTEVPPQEEQSEPTQRKGLSYKNQFDWNLQNFDEQAALKDLSRLANQNLAIQQIKNDPRFYIAESSIKSQTLKKQHIYILKGQNQHYDKIQITRKYSDFHALREILVKRWPGCFIPPIPEGNIGATQKQIFKNKEHIVTSFINRMMANQTIFRGEQFQVFIKSAENQVEKSLSQLKPHPLEELYDIYKAAWPQQFNQIHEITIQNYQEKIKKFQQYFSEMKKDLAGQKDQIRRLAELRTKLTAQRYLVLEKALPEYEQICLGWFNGITQLPGESEQKKQQEKEVKQGQQGQQKQKKDEDEIIQEKKPQIQNRIYSNPKYQSALEAYKDELFPKQDGENDDWLIYEQFKYELKQIEAILQAITTYKYLLSQKRYYQRNVESNKQQLQDINNNKMSLKILFLSGSEDEKKTQIANQIQILQKKYKLIQELWNALTQRVISEIEAFQGFRCEYYKKNLMRAFKKQAVYMAKLFNLYVEIHKL